jgi:hypothetical protein
MVIINHKLSNSRVLRNMNSFGTFSKINCDPTFDQNTLPKFSAKFEILWPKLKVLRKENTF